MLRAARVVRGHPAGWGCGEVARGPRDWFVVRVGHSTQRKAYVAVLGLALGGLALDRLVLSGVTAPASAGAAEVEQPAEAPASTTVAVVPVRPSLTQKLASLPLEDGPLVDAFRGTPVWLSSPEAPAEEEPKDQPSAPSFEQTYKLSSVVIARGGSGGAAVINGELVRVGMELAPGLVLRSVSVENGMSRAVFSDGRREYALVQVAEPPKKSGSRR